MIPIISLPSKIIRLLEANISPGEIAAGVCMGMFMGFIPLNGPMAVLLLICFLLFKINRLTAMLTLPVFKLFYVLGASYLTDWFGGIILIDIPALTGFWNLVTGLPVIAFLDINNTLVAGGFTLSVILCAPVFMGSRKITVLMREKYAAKIKNMAFIKFVRNIPVVNKITALIQRLRGGA